MLEVEITATFLQLDKVGFDTILLKLKQTNKTKTKQKNKKTL